MLRKVVAGALLGAMSGQGEEDVIDAWLSYGERVRLEPLAVKCSQNFDKDVRTAIGRDAKSVALAFDATALEIRQRAQSAVGSTVTAYIHLDHRATDMNVTVVGANPKRLCDQLGETLLNQNGDGTISLFVIADAPDQVTPGRAYAAQSSGSLICQHRFPSGADWTPRNLDPINPMHTDGNDDRGRDSGALKFYGNGLCQWIEQAWLPLPGATP